MSVVNPQRSRSNVNNLLLSSIEWWFSSHARAIGSRDSWAISVILCSSWYLLPHALPRRLARQGPQSEYPKNDRSIYRALEPYIWQISFQSRNNWWKCYPVDNDCNQNPGRRVLTFLHVGVQYTMELATYPLPNITSTVIIVPKCPLDSHLLLKHLQQQYRPTSNRWEKREDSLDISENKK